MIEYAPDFGHASGALDPVGAHSPCFTLTHSASLARPVLPLHVPPGQGVGALEPAVPQYEAMEQAQQAVAPVPFWKPPGKQPMHEAWPFAGCAVPGLHGVGSTAPVAHEAPGGHSRQSSALVIAIPSVRMVPFS